MECIGMHLEGQSSQRDIVYDFFVMTDIQHKHRYGSVGEVSQISQVYLVKTNLENEDISFFTICTPHALILVPTVKSMNDIIAHGFYRVSCEDCNNLFVFRDVMSIRNIKSARLQEIEDTENGYIVQWSIVDNKIRRFHVNTLLHAVQDNEIEHIQSLIKHLLSDTHEVIAEDISTARLLSEILKLFLTKLSQPGNQSKSEDAITENELVYLYAHEGDIKIVNNKPDEATTYYEVDIKACRDTFIYQQYISIFYANSDYIINSKTDVYIGHLDNKCWLYFINKYDGDIVDVDIVPVVEIIGEGTPAHEPSSTV